MKYVTKSRTFKQGAVELPEGVIVLYYTTVIAVNKDEITIVYLEPVGEDMGVA